MPELRAGPGTNESGECPAKKIPYRIAERGTRETQYRAIRRNRQEYPVKAMCEFFGVSRAVYYVWVKHLEQPNPHAEHNRLIQETYEKSHKTYGY